MKKWIIVFIVLFIATTCVAGPSNTIPKKEFIEITEQALDVLDEMEVMLAKSGTTKWQAENLFAKFDIVERKYYRSGKKTTKDQGEIILTMVFAKEAFTNPSAKSYTEGMNKAEEARALFSKYKK